MYSNSIDFGNYDYSGNPNLMPVLKAKDFSPNSQITIEDSENSLKVTFADSEGAKFLTSIKSVPALLPGTQYTLSADVTVLEGYKGDLNSLRLAYRKTPGGNILLYATARNAQVGKKTKIYAAANSSAATDPSIFDRMYFTIDTTSTDPFVGTVLVENIKVERGSTATPYQPNLLDDPYWVGKAPLGDNLTTGTFPVSNSQYAILGRVLKKNLEIGKTYTATLKGTKPTTQTFAAYSGGTVKFGDFKPVEGLTDVWSVTFTVSNLSNSPANFTLYQQPQATIGACQIDWLKIEKGNTRTPNISEYKYFGEGLKDSNNPNDYSWDITAEYTEKGLNDSVSLTEPQSVDGTKNFLETPLVNGKNVLVEEKPLPYEAWHSTGTEQTGISNKARLIIGPVATTIGAKLNRSMKENPLTWNSGNWQATANRDCTLLVEGLVRYQFGGSTAGQYGYITFYKDDAQTSSIGFAGGVGINGTALQWKHGLHFSRIFALKKGEYFNITFETQDGKKLDFSQINTLHIMEIES